VTVSSRSAQFPDAAQMALVIPDVGLVVREGEPAMLPGGQQPPVGIQELPMQGV
jgi:hypothetical protein